MTTLERRAAAEVRVTGRRMIGHAALFGVEARIGSMTETVRRGAFSATLAGKADVLALVDHDPGKVLGRTRSGTLRLSEDTRGLAFEIDVPDTSAGRDVLALAERGDLAVPASASVPLLSTGAARGGSCARSSWSRSLSSPATRLIAAPP